MPAGGPAGEDAEGRRPVRRARQGECSGSGTRGEASGKSAARAEASGKSAVFRMGAFIRQQTAHAGRAVVERQGAGEERVDLDT